MDLGHADDEEVVLHGGAHLVELEVFRKDDRALEGAEEAFFHEETAGFNVDVGADAFSGNREHVAGDGDVDGVDGDARERSDDDYCVVLIENVESDLPDVFFDRMFSVIVVVHVDFIGMFVVMSDIEKLEHGAEKRGKIKRNRIRSRAFCKFFGGVLDWEKALQIRKKPALDPLQRDIPETETPIPETPAEKPVGFSPKTEAGLAKKSFFIVEKNFSAGKLKVARADKIFFLDAFGSLVNAGIPIVRALQIIYFQSRNEKLRGLALFLKREIEGGANMAKTAANLPNVFSTFDVAMFEMGEATGKIGKVLEIVTEREEKSLELSRKVRQALVYPIAIAVVAVAMITVIMTYVVPKIEGIYREAHANLPALTNAVIWTSRFLRGYGILLLIFGFLAATTIPIALKKPAIRMQFDEMILRIPVFGTILRKKILVSYCEFLASLLTSGIVINRALGIVKSGLGNLYYEAEIEALLEDVKTGKPLSASMGGEYTERKIR